jgi:hypothetical protein
VRDEVMDLDDGVIAKPRFSEHGRVSGLGCDRFLNVGPLPGGAPTERVQVGPAKFIQPLP